MVKRARVRESRLPNLGPHCQFASPDLRWRLGDPGKGWSSWRRPDATY